MRKVARTVLVGTSVAAAVSLLVGAIAWGAYLNRTGCVSELNYERIQKGMTLEEVEALLGGQGQEIRPDEVYLAPPYTRRVADTGIPKATVPGERYYRNVAPDDSMAVVIGVVDGRVFEKNPIMPKR